MIDKKFHSGLTLIELMIAIGMLMILFALSTINLTRLPSSTSQSSSYDLLVNDIKSQQNMAMSGFNNTPGATDGSAYGIHLESTSYILFKGDQYVEGASDNFIVNLDPNLSFTTDLPAGMNNSIVFMAGSGDVAGYDPAHDSISLANSVTGESKQMRLNKYGTTY